MKKPTLDLSYARAATVMARQPEEGSITIALVGCGGTGSFLAQYIGRLLYAFKEKGQLARAIFLDHDRVEEQNIGRQLFCRAEIGRNKAEALAERYGAAWGLDIAAVPARFEPGMLNPHGDELTVLVGCVDNAHGRKQMKIAVDKTRRHGHEPGCKCPPDIWWLDCGNHENAGQVLLGSANSAANLKHAFASKTIVQSLPSPAMQAPELLIPAAHENPAKKKLSCAELTLLNLQSLNINARIAAEAGEFLTGLLFSRNLKRYGWEVNLAAGSSKSHYTTKENLRPYLKENPS